MFLILTEIFTLPSATIPLKIWQPLILIALSFTTNSQLLSSHTSILSAYEY